MHSQPPSSTTERTTWLAGDRLSDQFRRNRLFFDHRSTGALRICPLPSSKKQLLALRLCFPSTELDALLGGSKLSYMGFSIDTMLLQAFEE